MVHNEPLEFADLREEAAFSVRVRATTQIRNPKYGNYKWNKEEILQAVKDGLCHGFAIGNGLYSQTPDDQAVVFNDKELGERVRQATLRGDLYPEGVYQKKEESKKS